MLNRAILMGRLVADPELRQTPNGISVVSFRIAVNRNYTSKDGTQQADFIDVIAWRQSAEFVCKYFSKGKMIIVEGSIQTRNYEDKNGNKRTAVEVVAEHVQFGETKSSASSGKTSAPTPSKQPSYTNTGDSTEELSDDSQDLPF